MLNALPCSHVNMISLETVVVIVLFLYPKLLLSTSPSAGKECLLANSNHTKARQNVPDALNDVDVPLFQPGALAEVFDPKVHARLAFPAKIFRVLRKSDGSFRYAVYPGFGYLIPEVDPSSVRALKPWDDRAEAMCDGGDALNAELYPCTVLHRIPNSNEYAVSYRDRDSVERYKRMPFCRIRRIVKET